MVILGSSYCGSFPECTVCGYCYVCQHESGCSDVEGKPACYLDCRYFEAKLEGCLDVEELEERLKDTPVKIVNLIDAS
jgi:hypothetical protein